MRPKLPLKLRPIPSPCDAAMPLLSPSLAECETPFDVLSTSLTVRPQLLVSASPTLQPWLLVRDVEWLIVSATPLPTMWPLAVPQPSLLVKPCMVVSALPQLSNED